jgi:hypothetical protein
VRTPLRTVAVWTLVVVLIAGAGAFTYNRYIRHAIFTDVCGMDHLGPEPAPTPDFWGNC